MPLSPKLYTRSRRTVSNVSAHSSRPAKEIFEALKKAGIYVRYWDKPRIGNHLRITIGTDEEMEQLYAFLEKFL